MLAVDRLAIRLRDGGDGDEQAKTTDQQRATHAFLLEPEQRS
jgi:hypothetical protein